MQHTDRRLPERRGTRWLLFLLVAGTAGCGRGEGAPPEATTTADTIRTGRATVATARPAPRTLDGLVADYASNGDTLMIREAAGRLEAVIRSGVHPLRGVSEDRYALGDGSVPDREILFRRDGDGSAAVAVLDDVPFHRIRYGGEAGATFRIEPVRPVGALRAEARAASPPAEDGDFREPDLVDLATLDPTIRFDIRYATTNNFMGTAFYEDARAFLQRPAAEALLRAHERLRGEGYGLLVFDAYRPWAVTSMFWRATPQAQRQYVANPAFGSRHNRGAAVDVTLYDLATGEPVPMPSGYDEFSRRAHPDYPGGMGVQRRNRDLLRAVMESEGFRVYHVEWWHFDHRDWRRYPILDLTFDEIDS